MRMVKESPRIKCRGLLKWYWNELRAKEMAYSPFILRLGVPCIKHGKGVPQDYKEAVKWYQKAAEQGNAQGQVYLGGIWTRTVKESPKITRKQSTGT